MLKQKEHERENNRGKSEEVESGVNETHDTPWELEERYDLGSKSWGDVQKDKYQYTTELSFPACSSARTTIYARDAEDEQHYTVLFKLQHGRRHHAEQLPDGYSEGWDGQKVRQEDSFKYVRADTILSQAEVKGVIRQYAVDRVMKENLQGFSRYYQGIDGAALGFAALRRYDDAEMAKNSHLVDYAEEELDIDGEKLMDYVWRKYEGDD